MLPPSLPQVLPSHTPLISTILPPVDAMSPCEASPIIEPQMTLSAGKKLGPFEITGMLGSGGMGEVYRAHDARLGRDVAIKVLPERFSKDTDRLRRFEQEARAAGILNHPNILAIYDVGTHDGSPYVVSELLEGETLREALNRGAIPLRKTIDYAAQIASGLAAAHDKGIVHRDLKPENLFVTKEGRVKILDFGLAKLTQTEQVNQSALPTVANGTDPGVVLGTAGYMSPEQVRGQSVDHRSDIFSFGAILYEILSGNRAFDHDSAVETMSAILKEEPPDFGTQRADVPPALDRILRRCLEKQQDRRFRSASDLGFALETLSTPSATSGAVASTADNQHLKPGWTHGRFPVVAALLAGIALTIAATTIAGLFRRGPEQQPPAWNGSLLVGGSTIAFGPRVSPDGRTVAFQVMVDGQTQLAVLQVNSGDWEGRTSERSEGTIFNVSWSNDGTKIFYDRVRGDGDRIYSVPAVGGPERLVLENARIPESLPDGSLLFNRLIAGRFQLHRFWPDTARLEPLPAFPSLNAPAAPVRALPGGRQAVFYGYGPAGGSASGAIGSTTTTAHLFLIDLTTKNVTRLAPSLELVSSTAAAFPLAVSHDGRTALLDLPSGDLHRIVAVPLDGGSAVRTLLMMTAPLHFIDAGADGSIYVDQQDVRLEVVRTTANGTAVERLVKSAIGPQYCSELLALPDGRVLFPTQAAGQSRLLTTIPGKEPKPFIGTTEESAPPMTTIGADQIAFLLGRSPNKVIGVASAADGRLTRRIDVPGGAEITCLASSADGKTIYYISNRTLWVLPSNGREPRKLTEADAIALHPKTGEIILQRSEPDGAHFFRFDAANGREQRIEIRAADGPPSVMALLSSAAIAPDGRIVVAIAPRDSWNYALGVLDPLSFSIKRVPMNYSGGLINPAWTSDGRIVFSGVPIQSSIWRFRPITETSQNR